MKTRQYKVSLTTGLDGLVKNFTVNAKDEFEAVEAAKRALKSMYPKIGKFLHPVLKKIKPC